MPLSKNSSLSEIAHSKIKELIITLELPPGSQVDEAKLMEKLSIGRTPVREALFRLVTSNLLINWQGRGFVVRPITIEDIKYLFEATMVIWRAADVMAMETISEGMLELLYSTNSELKKAASKMDFYSINSLNSEFHGAIHKTIKNDFIRHAVQTIEPQYSRLSYLNLSDKKNKKMLKNHYQLIAKDHDDILDAFKQRDKDRVFEISTIHLQRFCSRISKSLIPTEHVVGMTFIKEGLEQNAHFL